MTTSFELQTQINQLKNEMRANPNNSELIAKWEELVKQLERAQDEEGK